MNTFSNNSSNDNYQQLNIRPKIDSEPLDGFDARLNHKQFEITDQVLKDMSYNFNSILYHFISNDTLQVGDIVEVIGHQSNILVVKKVFNEVN